MSTEGRRPRAERVRVVTKMSANAARQLLEQSRRARRRVAIVTPLVIGVLLAYRYRIDLFGSDMPVRVACAVALVALGWWFARDLVRAARPALVRRLEPAQAGTVGFVIRLALLVLTLWVALRIAGLQPRALAVGGVFTAVVLGLAAQNTLGNVIAGVLLASAQPFSVGDRVRFQGGGLAGQVEGMVTSLGLLYVTLTSGEDAILIPNNIAMSSAVVPLREPASVDLRARLNPEIKPSELQSFLEERVTVPTRGAPHIAVEEVDDDEVIMRVFARPEFDSDGTALADQITAAIADVTRRSVQSARSGADDA
jgi:small conductance mechanosensitive channel